METASQPAPGTARSPATDHAVVIWRSILLPGSETFIRNQADALTRWRPTLLGAVRTDSAVARETDRIAYPGGLRGRAAFLRLRATGRSRRLVDLLGELRPALIHAHLGGDAWLISHSAAELGIPMVVTLHGRDVMKQPDAAGGRGARYRRNLRTAFDRAALILAVSESTYRRAIELGADPAKTRVHYTGVPIPPAAPATAKSWDVAFVGRFVEKKGLDDLVEALAILRDLRPRTVFIGSGPLAGPVRERAAALGLDATFLGAQAPAAVAHHLARALVFAAPSRIATDGDAEGLPTTILEAASLGVPAVSTLHSGIPEAVTHGQTGLLGPERDPVALAGHLRLLLTDDALRARLGEQARRRAQDAFDLRKQTRRLEDLYEVVAGPPGRG